MHIKTQLPGLDARRPVARRPAMAGLGRLRKIALLGGAFTLPYAPWQDLTWELWAHMSCRRNCVREPDIFFDLHPPELWRDPKRKFWDPTYYQWLQQNHVPIYMQEAYKDVLAAKRYPFEPMITEFPRGYMTNTVAYMIALALMEGVTHLALYGCHYDAAGEYGPQRGCAEYWCGVAEGRGVQVLIPPRCDLLNRPSLLYGYQSHPQGKRDPSYLFAIGASRPGSLKTVAAAALTEHELVPADAKDAPPLRDLGEPPALDRRDHWDEFVKGQQTNESRMGVQNAVG